MEKINLKALIVAGVIAATLALAAGCAQPAASTAASSADSSAAAASSAEATSADSSAADEASASEDAMADDASSAEATTAAAGVFDENDYPAHVASMTAGEGIASLHTACTDCHDDALASQIASTGAEGEPELSSLYYVDTEKCQTCHGDYETLSKATESLGDYNPHASIHGTIEFCNECHKGHSSQVDICGECHPNGGQTMKN
ncbi:MAG: cytochrome c3 family protein [Eggerthellaceae bacterium]|nr:cytochrome c3 family protein [Eggerthellaceae bacterium]